MKKIKIKLIMSSVLLCSMILGGCSNKTAIIERVEVERIVTKSEEGLYIEDGQQYIEFNDGSWAICGNEEYIFQPAELGDWSYELDNQEQLENIIKTYLSVKNEGKF